MSLEEDARLRGILEREHDVLPASSIPATVSVATLTKNRPYLAPPVKRVMKAETLEKKPIFQQTVCASK